MPSSDSTKKFRRKSLRGAPIDFIIKDVDSVLHLSPQIPMKAELYIRDYTPNPNRIYIQFGDMKLVMYLDSKKGFILDKDGILIGHIDKYGLRSAFYSISKVLKALKNTKLQRKRTYVRIGE